jgi:hypothetical protein
VDPAQIESFITELATAVSKRLEKEGLLAPGKRAAGSGAS